MTNCWQLHHTQVKKLQKSSRPDRARPPWTPEDRLCNGHTAATTPPVSPQRRAVPDASGTRKLGCCGFTPTQRARQGPFPGASQPICRRKGQFQHFTQILGNKNSPNFNLGSLTISTTTRGYSHPKQISSQILPGR